MVFHLSCAGAGTGGSHEQARRQKKIYSICLAVEHTGNRRLSAYRGFLLLQGAELSRLADSNDFDAEGKLYCSFISRWRTAVQGAAIVFKGNSPGRNFGGNMSDTAVEMIMANYQLVAAQTGDCAAGNVNQKVEPSPNFDSTPI